MNWLVIDKRTSPPTIVDRKDNEDDAWQAATDAAFAAHVPPVRFAAVHMNTYQGSA